MANTKGLAIVAVVDGGGDGVVVVMVMLAVAVVTAVGYVWFSSFSAMTSTKASFVATMSRVAADKQSNRLTNNRPMPATPAVAGQFYSFAGATFDGDSSNSPGPFVFAGSGASVAVADVASIAVGAVAFVRG